MVWQDLLISFANVLFAYSLSYQVYRGFKERKGVVSMETSVLMCIGSVALAVSFFTLDLFVSTFLTSFLALLWAILFYQKMNYK